MVFMKEKTENMLEILRILTTILMNPDFCYDSDKSNNIGRGTGDGTSTYSWDNTVGHS